MKSKAFLKLLIVISVSFSYVTLGGITGGAFATSKYSNFQRVLESSEFKQRTSELNKSEIQEDDGFTPVLSFDDSASFENR